MSSIFISYRREDAQWIARSLHQYLSQIFGVDRVFMDRIEIHFGDDWREVIQQGLASSTILIPVIGPRWLEFKDEKSCHRRIDKEDDWVRAEIREALNSNKKIFPLYVDGAKPIVDPSLLPSDIDKLVRYHYVEISEMTWEASLLQLVKQLATAAGFTIHNPSVHMPERRKRIDPLTRQDLDQFRNCNPKWRVTSSQALAANGLGTFLRTELYREYQFGTFQKATQFMAKTSPAIDQLQHHPRWENIWKTVRVWLSTWDIEFQPSEYDLSLAKLLDEQFELFNSKAFSKQSGKSSKAT